MSDIIERYVHDALRAIEACEAAESVERRAVGRIILRDIAIYFADHMSDVRATRAELAGRPGPDAAVALAFLDATLAAHADADRLARDVLAEASRRPGSPD